MPDQTEGGGEKIVDAKEKEMESIQLFDRLKAADKKQEVELVNEIMLK